MNESLEEFKQWECDQLWPLDEAADGLLAKMIQGDK